MAVVMQMARGEAPEVCLAQPTGLGNQVDATRRGPTARPFGDRQMGRSPFRTALVLGSCRFIILPTSTGPLIASGRLYDKSTKTI